MDSAKEKKQYQKWFPLESNPSLMNGYISKLGFNTDLYEFVDVFSYEEWALQMIPQPVVAVIMLYPLTETQLSHPDSSSKKPDSSTTSAWFIKQRIGNACGTIGLLHTVMNVPSPLNQFKENSWLDKFQISCTGQDPIQRAALLEGDDDIATHHDAATSSTENATGRGDLNENLITHFIALVERDGVLLEMDGRKDGPIAHGPTSNLLTDACAVVQQFMKRDPDELRFTILALAPKTTNNT